MSASAYYERATGQRSERAIGDERLLARIEDLHAQNYFAYAFTQVLDDHRVLASIRSVGNALDSASWSTCSGGA